MSSLSLRVAMLSVFCIVLTLFFTFVLQNRYFAHMSAQSDLPLQEAIRNLDQGPDLPQEEESRLLQDALRRTVATEEGRRQLIVELTDFANAQERIPLTATIQSLPIALLVSLAGAWLVARPIRQVSAAAAQIAKGNLKVRAPSSGNWGTSAGELIRLVSDFNAMAESLETLESERQHMIADIAHELRTPLTVLQGHIDAMREGVRPLNDASLASLDRQTQHLARLVQDLRTLSLAETKRLSLDLRVLDPARFVERVAASFSEKAAEKFIDLSFVSTLDGNTRVEADPDRLEQVLTNLIDNAIRHTPERGNIIVSVQKYADQIRLSVADSGRGLSGEGLAHVFDRFYRAEGHAKGAANSGLGLAISKALVELHRGVISVENTPQGGAVFYVLLPIVPAV